MKIPRLLLAAILLIFLSGSAYSEYSASYCTDLQNDINVLEAKLKKWEALVYNPHTIMVQFVCDPGEYIVACGVRCGQKTKSDCINAGGRVWAIMNKYLLQGHPRYADFDQRSQTRKDRIMGTRKGSGGKIPGWKKELERLKILYETNYGKNSGGGKFMGADTGDLNWEESK